MKRYFTIMMVLVVAFGASAKFRFGPTVGMNISRYYWSQKLFETPQTVGYSAGIQCEVMIPGIGFGIDFGLKYADRGGRCNFREQYVWSSTGIGNTDLRLHTIQIPVNLRFKWTKMDGFENYLAPFAYAGPQFNFNASTSRCAAIRKVNAAVGLEVGLGVELWKRFQLSAGYVWDMTDDVESIKLDEFTAHLQGWMIDFTVLF